MGSSKLMYVYMVDICYTDIRFMFFKSVYCKCHLFERIYKVH
jgi:hypothetical protein